MLFQSDYWLASNHTQYVETIINFLQTDEGITNLIIVDTSGSESISAIILNLKLNNELDCSVNLYTDYEACTYEHTEATHTKNIYLRNSFDTNTFNIMRNLYPILAIFVS